MNPDHAKHVDACAALLALPIAAEYRDGVIGYFGLAASMADLVNGLALALDDEPAEVFVPVSLP